MNISYFIAKRYFFRKSQNNFVHFISLVSFFGVMVGSAALILVLSVFNGFEDLVLNMYNSFDPHIKIQTTQGKVFEREPIEKKLSTYDQIEENIFVLEEKVLLNYNDKEFIAIAKGVSDNYEKAIHFDSLIVEGRGLSSSDMDNVAVMGSGIAYYLSMGLGSVFENIQLYIPKREEKTLLNIQKAFEQHNIVPVGIFNIQNEIDSEYFITPLSFLQKISNRENRISSVEIKLKDPKEMYDFQQLLKNSLGNNYLIQNRFEQQQFLYKILNSEKLAVFIIFLFIILIATFNIIGSLTMLILDKRKDIFTLKSLGLNKIQIQKIFFKKNMFTILFGVLIGLLMGLSIAFAQQNFGLISLGDGNFVVDSFPVSIRFSDVILVFSTVFIIGVFSSWIPAKILTKKLFR
ncbi:MAG: hypothetical protein CMP69_00395 [Flavobacteriales bacterium]|nr:hypothetical protein [Flavobacteriales bacterium]